MSPTPPFPPIDAANIEAELKNVLPSLFGAGLSSQEVKKAFGYQTFEIRATDGRGYLLKIARQAPEVARLEALAGSVALARSGGVRTPDIVRVGPAALLFDGRPYLVQEYLPGRDAEDAWATLDEKARQPILAEWGRETARLHAIASDQFTESPVNPGQEADWPTHVANRLARLIHSNQKALVLEASELKRVESKIVKLLSVSATEVKPTLTHRDLCLKNVLVSPEGTFSALLDFEHARMSDPVMDFVKLGLWVFARTPGSEAAFRKGYREEKPEPWPREAERHEIGLLLELLGEIPYYKRNSAQAELGQAVARLRERIR